MRRSTAVTLIALTLLSAPAFAQYGGGGQNAGGPAGSQMRQSTGGAQNAMTGSTGATTKKATKSRKRMMNTTSGNCWDARNPACQNYRGPPR